KSYTFCKDHLGGSCTLPYIFCRCIFCRMPPLPCQFSIRKFQHNEAAGLPVALQSFGCTTTNNKFSLPNCDGSGREFFIFFIQLGIRDCYIYNNISWHT